MTSEEGERSHREYVTLKEYIESRLDSMQRATEVAIQAAQRATEKAETANNARFANVNEFRQALQDQTREYLPRAEFNIQHKAIEDRVDNLTRAFTEATKLGEGKSQGMSMVGYLVYSAIIASGAAATVVILLRSLH